MNVERHWNDIQLPRPHFTPQTKFKSVSAAVQMMNNFPYYNKIRQTKSCQLFTKLSLFSRQRFRPAPFFNSTCLTRIRHATYTNRTHPRSYFFVKNEVSHRQILSPQLLRCRTDSRGNAFPITTIITSSCLASTIIHLTYRHNMVLLTLSCQKKNPRK